MLALVLTIGAVLRWFHYTQKLKYEFDRGRTHGETERAVLQTRLEEERKANQEKLTLLNNAKANSPMHSKRFRPMLWRNNNQSFLDLAKQNLETFQQTARGELERRQSAIGDMIKPLKESLEKVDGKIGELEKSRVGAYSGVARTGQATRPLAFAASVGNWKSRQSVARTPCAWSLGRDSVTTRGGAGRHASVLRF
jgi:hypothetical protein